MIELYFATLKRWDPSQRIDGVRYGWDIDRWADADLVGLGLYRAYPPSDIPDGKEPSAELEWDGAGVRYVLVDAPPPPRRMIRKSLVKQRLIDLGLMDAAYAALTSQPVAFARWFDMDYPEVYADDPDALALLDSIGADPEVVMAP